MTVGPAGSFPLRGPARQAPLPLDLPRPSGRRSGETECEGEGEPGSSLEAELLDQLVDQALAEAAVVVTLVDLPGAGERAGWYRVGVQPTLDGGVDVVRAWGCLPVGGRPRELVSTHGSVGEASAALRAVVTRRLRRGYRPGLWFSAGWRRVGSL